MSQYFSIISPDGGGKDALFNQLLTIYPNAVQMYEPGGTKEADVIRHVLLDKDLTIKERTTLLKILVTEKELSSVCQRYLLHAILLLENEGMTGMAEAYLYAASRAETNEKIIKPSLEEGKMVLARRTVACSMSYQGHARGIGMDKIWKLNQPALHECYPSLEIFLDVPAEVAQGRIQQRTEKQDRLDNESIDFHRKTVEGYHKYYKEYCPYPHIIVDGTQTKEKVFEDVAKIIKNHLQTN